MSETAKKYYCDKCGKEITSPTSYWIIDNHRYCQECYNLHFSIEAQLKQKDAKIADLEAKLVEAQKPKEIRFNGFVVDCNYDEARKVLQEDILKMQAENKKLKESEELSNYAKCVLENKKLEEDLELSEKCCVEYEEEINQLKQQLAEKEKEIERLKESSDKNIDYLIEFASLIESEKDCNRMLKALERVKKGKKYIVDKEHQSKTEFAIQQLERVKETVIEKDNEMFLGIHIGRELRKLWIEFIAQIINNQINEIKGGQD